MIFRFITQTHTLSRILTYIHLFTLQLYGHMYVNVFAFTTRKCCALGLRRRNNILNQKDFEAKPTKIGCLLSGWIDKYVSFVNTSDNCNKQPTFPILIYLEVNPDVFQLTFHAYHFIFDTYAMCNWYVVIVYVHLKCDECRKIQRS